MLRRVFATVGIVAVTLLSVTLSAQQKVDVTGKWVLSVETGAGTGTPTLTLKQDGEKLTGHYSSQTFGEVDVTGSLKGNAIEFSFSADAQGTALKVTYKGTVESKDAMKGTVDLGGLGEGTWTGKKQ